MIQEYGDISDANFLCCGIGEEGIEETVSWCAYKDHFCQRARIAGYFLSNQIDAISLLAIDIEGESLMLCFFTIGASY